MVRVTAAWAWPQPMRTGCDQSDSCLGTWSQPMKAGRDQSDSCLGVATANEDRVWSDRQLEERGYGN